MSALNDWLKDIGLEQFAEIFADNGVDMRALPHLTEDDYKDLGLLLGQRRRLGAAISLLSKVPPEIAPLDRHSITTIDTERREVTIMFADLVGYTQMSSELDAEDLHAILGYFLDASDQIIVEHGGTIDKHLGDCVMAVFGAPVAHSNDPERAARAALQIQAAMPEISKRAGRALHVHIGIANGQVVASGVGNDTHYTVTGDSVNLASRLTDIASQNEIVLSSGIQTVISTEFQVQDKGEIQVKGINNPVRAYALIRVARGEDKYLNERPFVGRQAETLLFSGLITACRKTNSGQVVYLRGEAGIGKTRLSAQFEAIANEAGFGCHRALVLDFGVGKQDSVIRTLIRSLVSLTKDSALDIRQRAADTIFQNGLLADELRVFLNSLLELPQSSSLRSIYDAIDGKGREQGKISVITGLLAGLCSQQPRLIIVEDIHWAEDYVIDFLAILTRELINQASILVMTSRIEGDPLGREWELKTATTPLTTIDLRPLRHVDAMELASEYFDTSNKFAQKCVERADGNPLYLEQLLRSAQEAGENQVPGSVHSIVQARLDSLLPIDKLAIQAASVIGQRFTLQNIRHMIDESDYDCSGLIQRYLIKPEGNGYLFSHAMVQEAVYQSLLKSRCLELHRSASEWYAKREPELHAIHLDRAKDPGAAKAYLNAAGIQLNELHYQSSIKHIKRGLQLTQQAAIKFELTRLQGDVLRNLGEVSSSISICQEALRIAHTDIEKCHAWLAIAEGLRIADQQDNALKALDTAESYALEQGLMLELSRIHYLRGNLYFMTGDIDGCLKQHEKSLILADETGSEEGKALALGGLGDAWYLRGHMRSARDQDQACINLCQSNGFGQIELANRYMVGWSRYFLMEFSEALDDARASIKMAKAVGYHRAEMIASDLAGLIELERGNFSSSRTHLENGLRVAQSLNAGNFVAQAKLFLGRLDILEDNKKSAQSNSQQALQIVRQVGMAFIGPAVLAACATLTDDKEQCLAYLQEAEQILDSGCVSHNHFYFAQATIELYLKAKNWDLVEHYAQRLEAYTADQPLEWSDFLIARGRTLIAIGKGRTGGDLTNELERLHRQGEQAGLTNILAELNPSG